ncbi:hypothetical protein BJ508DRAFT_333540 [Ascobolus immersus RN42]|uniref:F-box domain-containing protein n=1 Tax=Ascobolus immersus RN42 TaxID=1160509 RepID=A0A3N4HJ49_ASCIM|nr:hypothetical protein BJ508DRAFT_333540 [Ascobolus immersus RN42]
MADTNNGTVSRFLRLPLEMRLEIYSYSSIFGLFILTHTCRTIYTDINCSILVKRSAGYTNYTQTHAVFESHPLLPAGSRPLCIPMMARSDKINGLYQPSYRGSERHPTRVWRHESYDFNQLYGSHFRFGSRNLTGPWRCCTFCSFILLVGDFDYPPGFNSYPQAEEPEAPVINWDSTRCNACSGLSARLRRSRWNGAGQVQVL